VEPIGLTVERAFG